jgi:hypothetical protein
LKVAPRADGKNQQALDIRQELTTQTAPSRKRDLTDDDAVREKTTLALKVAPELKLIIGPPPATEIRRRPICFSNVEKFGLAWMQVSVQNTRPAPCWVHLTN